MKKYLVLLCSIFVLNCSITEQVFYPENIKIENNRIICEGYLNINDDTQYVLIRGTNIDNPILLFVHGGPGYPETGSLIKYNKDLENFFNVVYWEERASARSYSLWKNYKNLSLDLITDDMLYLTKYLIESFNKTEIFVFGHSFGTVISSRAAYLHPEYYSAIVGIGTVVDAAKSEIISYNYTLEKAKAENNKRAIKDLRRIGPPVNGKFKKNNTISVKHHRNWLYYYGGSLYGERGYGDKIKNNVYWKGYTIFESLKYGMGLWVSMQKLWEEYGKINMFNEISEIEVPFYFMHGRHDYQSSFTHAEKYYNFLKAPVKEFYWFDRSGHSPHSQEPDKFLEIMVDKVLKNNKE
ncbi:MAG: alpha/beta hydrolase [Bacteroidales bacterium]|nr:alpha/beta hydrolase [Bacteroidales bacterium]